MKRFIVLVLALILIMTCMVGCDYEGTYEDTINTRLAASNLQSNQPTPTDLDYSLERYNLIRRAYWVNGQREKANALVCEIEKPLGYIVLFGESGTVISSFVVDGKVSSLNSFLTPEYAQKSNHPMKRYLSPNDFAIWIAKQDGYYDKIYKR